MSNFKQMTEHPLTGKLEFATWLDDHFGPDRYGVKFPSDSKIYEIQKTEKKKTPVEFQSLRPEEWKKLSHQQKINYCKLHIKLRRILSSTQARWLVEQLEMKNA